ncbi:MAG: peptidoglycan synthetase [Sphingobacteriia bacterium]|nr:peptidoglycan synthetase [Sphingobacteriia bacterium]
MKIHFIAIGGAVMNNLAVSMVKKGFQVSGSDDEIFDPALSNLRKHGILPAKPGWFPEKITVGLDAVILGMHAKPGNPELDRALKLGLKVYSFPEYLYEQSRDKIRVVIAGSHGKTTITSMIMHVLRHQHIDFDYLVGAKTEGFDIMVRLTDAPVIVIEGDEYLTSALDPRPKFLHYKPHIALISGIAWDHINVFPTFSGYVEQFSLFIKSIEKNGHLIYCQNDPVLRQVVEESGRQDSSLPYAAVESVTENGKSWLIRQKPKFEKYPLKIFGNHNMFNISGALEVCRLLGIKEDDFNSAISTFKGAANRLERIADNGESAVFRDFAHAPSKLRATVESVKAQYPDRKLIAVMELHTYSSLSREFLSHYRNSMDQTDIPVVFFSPHAIALKKLPSISPEDVIKGFDHPDLKVFTDTAKLEEFIRSCKTYKTNLLMMSSGNFGGFDLQKLCSEIF